MADIIQPINTFLGTGSGPGSGPTLPPNYPTGGVPNTTIGGIPSAQDVVSNVAGSVFNSTLFSSRVVAIILGLIAIAGAILLYLGEDIAGAIGLAKKALPEA